MKYSNMHTVDNITGIMAKNMDDTQHTPVKVPTYGCCPTV